MFPPYRTVLMLKYLLLLIVGLCSCVLAPLTAQRFATTPEFDRLLEQLDATVNYPLQSDFRTIKTPRNDYLEDHLAVRSRAEKLEIRFHLRPERDYDIYAGRPHYLSMMKVMNLGSNADDAVTAVHSFGEEELAVFNADWARMYTFRPKRGYSEREQAQLVAIYREGRGMAFVVLLFDRAPETLEGRQLAVRFREE